MFQYCTKFNTLVSHVEQFERKFASAVISAFEPPRGPVHLSIPMDVMNATPIVTSPSFDLAKMIIAPSVLDRAQVESLSQMLQSNGKVAFLIGENASEAIGNILDTATLLNATILTTPHGKGLISPYHPLFRGVVGFAGHASAREVLQDEELHTLVAVGASLGEWASSGWDSTLILNKRLIHIDEQGCHLSQTPMARLHVQGKISTIFEQLLKNLQNSEEAKPTAKVESPKPVVLNREYRQFMLDDEAGWLDDKPPIKPQRLMHDLPEIFPPHTRYVADTGCSFAWAIHYLHPFDRRMHGKRDAKGGLFRACLEFSPMGWALGYAVCIAIALPGSPVVCITGDGSVLMNGQEITVALQQQLTVIYVVLNDSALGMVKHGQRLSGAEQIGTELPQVNFATMASAMGIPAHRITSSEELRNLNISEICHRRGPTLLDITIDKEAIPPIGARIKHLKASN